jgi:hypothetical protein
MEVNMKSLFVCSSNKINNHIGEEYDSILEVIDQPTTENIQEYANRIKGRIRSLWMEQVKAQDPIPKVVCNLDGPTPYNAILNNLQIIMKAEEEIIIELPYMVNVKMEVTDSEALSILAKLDGKKN